MGPHDSVEQASRMASRLAWDRKIAAHGEIFNLLAGVAGDRSWPCRSDARGHIFDLMVTAGSAADGIVLSGVAREMEQYLGTLGAQASEAPRLHPVVPPESRPNTKVY
jgi:hypothetical protein